ncbi:MAG: 50S ribosomal protein L1 [Candidatus Woykebacteria bacterium RBG_16_43_9]|uniref:Ribosomal protein n=1 Tax=Candidatus Woykebacteria bacterium RBG_16_43_9 TaxID=1802596 RepID=A0A1G1WCF3_9BACT|nr:MAG: 50S ribosomal protein L1 [Candidatus Woykebacteria bacterium RBG_16_43_9]
MRSKRYKEQISLIDRSKEYNQQEAISLIKKTATTKFDASIEAHINLGLSPDKPEHQIRTLVSLPHPTSPRQVGASRKPSKILVFTDKNKEEIKKLGAEIGTDSSIKEIESGKTNFSKVIADPSWMPKLAKVAKILGPKGLMPNPKSGTVSDDPLKTLKEFSAGRTEIKTEKFPIIQAQIGKASFTEKQLLENLDALISAINAARPEGLKKEFIKSIYLSSSMGPSIKAALSSLN